MEEGTFLVRYNFGDVALRNMYIDDKDFYSTIACPLPGCGDTVRMKTVTCAANLMQHLESKHVKQKLQQQQQQPGAAFSPSSA